MTPGKLTPFPNFTSPPITVLQRNEYFDINSVGCDSTAILVLTVNYSDATSSSEIACDEFIWDGVSYTSTGVYTNTYTNF